MPINIRLFAIAAITSLILYGTLYSVAYNTYLDTSNPLITTLPHHLHETHYFASKRNPLNVYFIKKLWLWTTSAFLFHFFTSPVSGRSPRRVVQYVLATSVWLSFTAWFFGPPILDRLIASTGGECILHLPSGAAVPVPYSYCHTRSTISLVSHPRLFPTAFIIPDEWKGTPRLRKGHDVSGHIFLLTLSTLFLTEQLRWTFFQFPRVRASFLHYAATAYTSVVIAASLLSIYGTSIYFHTPFEKFTGYVLGMASFAFTQLPLLYYDGRRTQDTL